MTWWKIGVLLGVAAVWVWVLGRPLLANLFNGDRRDPVGHWNRKMSVLGEAPQKSLAQDGPLGAMRPVSPFGPASGAPASIGGSYAAKKRRLQIFMALVIAAVVSLVFAIVWRGLFIWHHLLMDALLIGYVLLTARMGALAAERAKVTYIAPANRGAGVQIKAVAER